MSFLDRFKRKPNPEEPVAPIPEQKKTEPAKSPAPTKGSAAGQPAAQKTPPAADEVRLELGDFLHRIPAQLLLPGPHDLKTELRFDIPELSQRIARGETMLNLAEIYRRLPQIFRSEVLEGDNVEIRFPWQKIAKLVTNVKSTSGGAVTEQPSAEGAGPALAEKLRANKPAKPGAKTGKDAPAAPPPAPAGPVLPGRGGAGQASWFSRTGTDKPLEKSPQFPAQKPAAPDAGATPAPAAAAAKPAEPALRLTPAAAPAEKPAATKDDLQLSDLPEDIQRRVAVIRGDYERQLADLEKQRKALAEARDRSAEEAENLRRDLENAVNQVAEGNTAVSIRADLAGRANKEREKMQEELKAKHDEIDRLKGELAKFESAPQAPVVAPGARTKGGSDRAVEELNRRIKALEQTQKQTALELAREKEARSKAEKFLASADKRQEDTANYMESAKQEMRKEIEASVKQREADMRKALKDLQTEVDALQEHNETVNKDLEAARLRAAQLEVKFADASAPVEQTAALHAQTVERLEKEIEGYRDRLKLLVQERDAARVEKEKAGREVQAKIDAEAKQAKEREKERAAAEKRIEEAAARVASLEQLAKAKDGEIRELQGAIKQRDAAGNQLAELRGQYDALQAQHAEAHSQFTREREAILQERQQLAGTLREQTASLEQQLKALVVERDRLRGEMEAGSVRFNTEITGREQLAAKIQAEHAAAIHARDTLTKQLAESERAFKDLQKQNARLAKAGQGLLADPVLKSELDQLRKQLAAANEAEKVAAEAQQAAESELARLREERQNALAGVAEERATSERLEGQMAKVQAELAKLRNKLDNVTRERDEAETEMQRVAIALAALEKSGKQDITKLTAERDAARKEKDLIAEQLAEARAHHEHLSGSLDSTRLSLVTEVEKTQDKLANCAAPA